MSQYPRIVLSNTTVFWDPHANGALRSTFVRAGSLVDIKPGSALELAYGVLVPVRRAPGQQDRRRVLPG